MEAATKECMDRAEVAPEVRSALEAQGSTSLAKFRVCFRWACVCACALHGGLSPPMSVFRNEQILRKFFEVEIVRG